MRFPTPRQRKKHLRIFQGKIKRYSTTYLKKLREELWDQWTWETGDELDKTKVELVEAEIESRQGAEYHYEELGVIVRKMNKGRSLQRKRKVRRDGFKIPDMRGRWRGN